MRRRGRGPAGVDGPHAHRDYSSTILELIVSLGLDPAEVLSEANEILAKNDALTVLERHKTDKEAATDGHPEGPGSQRREGPVRR